MVDVSAIRRIGPADAGRVMTLGEFSEADTQPGHWYELEKGVVLVVDVPGIPHLLTAQAVRNALVAYQLAHPSVITVVASGMEMALRMPDQQSERHPDLAVYLTLPPAQDPQPWDYWMPEIAVEIVSKGSEDRDYRIKREEYLKAGLRAYWIINPMSRTATVLTRRGDTWCEEHLDETGAIRTSLLPEFSLPLAHVFAGLP